MIALFNYELGDSFYYNVLLHINSKIVHNNSFIYVVKNIFQKVFFAIFFEKYFSISRFFVGFVTHNALHSNILYQPSSMTHSSCSSESSAPRRDVNISQSFARHDLYPPGRRSVCLMDQETRRV